MPIEGLSQRRRLSRGGKIRLGEKKISQSGKEYPSKTDYFVFDPEDDSLIPAFNALFGEKPKRIKICFPVEDMEVVFPQYYKCYGSNGLLCKGDGRCALRTVPDSAEMAEVECPGPAECDFALARRDKAGKPGCKQLASLQFFIPDLPGMQVFQIDTTSYNSIININSQLDVLRGCCGRISMVPLDLMLAPREAKNPENGKKIIIYVLDLTIPVSLRELPHMKSLGAPMLEAPKPIEASAPEDLYAKSSLREPDQEPDVDPDVDVVTGEIITPEVVEDGKPALPLDEDPDVLDAMEFHGLNPSQKAAMFKSAIGGGWDKWKLIEVVKKSVSAGAKPAARTAPAPAPTNGGTKQTAPARELF